MTDSLLDRVAEIISRYSMAPRGSRIGVAISGGADSVVLLHLLAQLREKNQFALVALHVNHQLRGSESEDDELFVRELTRSLDVPLRVEHCHSAARRGNLEQSAREDRRAFFLSALREEGLDRVATGHSLSDQAETVLFRLLRGAGLAGLAGMRPVTADGFVRPLLFFTREEIRAHATINGFVWREDSSNTNVQFRRNRLRREIMPRLIGEFNPNLEQTLGSLASLAGTEEDYWSELIEPLFKGLSVATKGGLILSVEKLVSLHLAVKRRVLRRAFREVRGDLLSIEMPHVEAVINLCKSLQGHDRALLPGLDALRSFGSLRLTRPLAVPERRHYRLPVVPGKELSLPFQAGVLLLEASPAASENCVNFKNERGFSEADELDLDALGGLSGLNGLAVRNWEPGDEYQRVGHSRPEKLKTLFQEHKVLLWDRRHWPILERNQEEIVWSRDFGVAARFAAGPASKAKIRVTFRPSSYESNVFAVTSE